MIIRLYMESGNVVEIDNVKYYEIITNDSSVRSIKIKKRSNHLLRWLGKDRNTIIDTINLSRIEAVVVE